MEISRVCTMQLMEWHDVVWYENHWICSFDDNTKINQICRFVLCQQHYGHHVEFKLYQTSFYRTIRAVFGFPRPVLHLIISSLKQTAENVETRIVLNEKYHKNLHCDKAKSKHHDSVLMFKKTIFFLSNEERPKLIVKRVINSNLRVRITKQTKNEQIYLWTQ